MPRNQNTITRADLLSLEDYETIRAEKKQDAMLSKKYRRMAIGPSATIVFESWDSMWLQIQEMLRIEKGGDEQIADELAAYNPMIPNGQELTATLFFEINDPVQRADFLNKLGGVEEHIFLSIQCSDGSEIKIAAVPEGDVDRSTESGKASAVHFLHFPFSAEAVRRFKETARDRSKGGNAVLVGIDHPNYGHIAMVSTEMHRELTKDFLST